MHETLGDGYITDGGKRVFADEDLGSGRDATQVRHQEANSWQEEIANVIRSEGITLNDPSELISQMTQLNQAINAKVAAEAALRVGGDNSQQAFTTSQIALVNAVITALKASEIANDSSITGASVQLALNWILGQLTLLSAQEDGVKSSGIPITVISPSVWTPSGGGGRIYWKKSVNGKFVKLWGYLQGTITVASTTVIDIILDASFDAAFTGWTGGTDLKSESIASAVLGGSANQLMRLYQTPSSPAGIRIVDQSGIPIPMGSFFLPFQWFGSFL